MCITPMRTNWSGPASRFRVSSALPPSCSIADQMPKPNETYRILFSGDIRCGKTSIRARIAGQAFPNYIQLTLLHEFPLVECLVPKEDLQLDEEAWKGWQTGAVEGPTEGEVGGGRRAGTGKRRAKRLEHGKTAGGSVTIGWTG
jgi:hypothetical protein